MVDVGLGGGTVARRLVVGAVDHPRSFLESLLDELVVVAAVLHPELENGFRAID